MNADKRGARQIKAALRFTAEAQRSQSAQRFGFGLGQVALLCFLCGLCVSVVKRSVALVHIHSRSFLTGLQDFQDEQDQFDWLEILFILQILSSCLKRTGINVSSLESECGVKISSADLVWPLACVMLVGSTYLNPGVFLCLAMFLLVVPLAFRLLICSS